MLSRYWYAKFINLYMYSHETFVFRALSDVVGIPLELPPSHLVRMVQY